MLTDTKSTRVSELLEMSWPNASREIVNLFLRFREAGCRFILFNLPINYGTDDSPTDLDLILDPSDCARAIEILRSEGYVPFTHSPGTNQIVLVGSLASGEFIRLHLHRDIWIMGICLAKLEWMERFCHRDGTNLIPSPELDFFLLHIQWLFKRKKNYPNRIDQVRTKVRSDRLNELSNQLTGKVARLFARLIHDCEIGKTVTVGYKLSMCAMFFPLKLSMYAAVTGKWLKRIRTMFRWRRRGLFVYIMGIDGTGKTSLATEIVKAHDRGGMIAKYAYLGLKVTVVQKIRSRLLKQNDRERFDGQSGVADKLATKSRFVSNLFNLCLTMIYLADYLVRTSSLLSFIRRDNNLIVVDRAYYDKLTEPDKLGNKLFYYLLPKPDLVVALHGDLQVLYDRKQEFEIDVLSRMQRQMDGAWKLLADKNINLLKIDTGINDLAACVDLVNERIWQSYKSGPY